VCGALFNNVVSSISGFDNRWEDAEHGDGWVHLPWVLDTPTSALPSKVGMQYCYHHSLTQISSYSFKRLSVNNSCLRYWKFRSINAGPILCGRVLGFAGIV
jgi:hypothetical protein